MQEFKAAKYDVVEIDRRARQLRAEAVRYGAKSMVSWAKNRLHMRPTGQGAAV